MSEKVMKIQFKVLLLVFFVASSVSAFEFRTREQWGAKDPKPDMTLDPAKWLFVVHHTAGYPVSSDAVVRAIQNFHMETRGWADVGYHFLIGPDGKVYQGRDLNYAGAHAYGHNKGSVGVNFMGCYDTLECHAPAYPEVTAPSDIMIESMGELIGNLSLHFGIELSRETVKGHRELAGARTSCPGDLIMERMAEIIARAVLFTKGMGRLNDEL
jgi:hypothetical protein